MVRIKKQFFIIVCSFLLGAPIHINATKQESPNGCNAAIYTNVDDFYKEKPNSIDVLALGDSNIYRGFSPMVFWEDTHVSSYSLASANEPAWLSYYLLEDALTYQKPKVVIFELNELFSSPSGQTRRYCNTINSLRTEHARFKAIRNEYSGFDDEDRELLFKTYTNSLYQKMMTKVISSKVQKETTEKAKPKANHYKGYLLEKTIVPFLTADSYMSRYDLNLTIEENRSLYVDNIIELCKKNKITLLFTKFPTKEWTAQKSELARAYATSKKIPFFDMNRKLGNIDWMKDTKDGGFHMNDTGASKCTKAVESWIAKYKKLTPTEDINVIESFDEIDVIYRSKR